MASRPQKYGGKHKRQKLRRRPRERREPENQRGSGEEAGTRFGLLYIREERPYPGEKQHRKQRLAVKERRVQNARRLERQKDAERGEQGAAARKVRCHPHAQERHQASEQHLEQYDSPVPAERKVAARNKKMI